MIHEPDDDLTEEERRGLAALPREAFPPTGLEQRLVTALGQRGVLRPGNPGLIRWVVRTGIAAVAAAVLFASGLAVGRRAIPGPEAQPTGRFALLLYQGPAYADPAPGDEAARVAEYVAWARSAPAGGLQISGEKLKDQGVSLALNQGRLTEMPTDSASDRGDIVGYFVVAAPAGLPQVIELARTCPHLRYGGTVLVREIEPT